MLQLPRASSSATFKQPGPLQSSLSLRRSRACSNVRKFVLRHEVHAPGTEGSTAEGPQQPVRVPRSIQEVDNGAILGFGSDLADNHPGFHDDVYKRRRAWISNLARQHRINSGPIPRIEYTPEEVATWAQVLSELKQLFPEHACQQYLSSFPLLNFREDQVPQLEDVSQILMSRTGWQIRPVAGLLHPRDFLAGLAFKYFHSTQYLRHHSQPSYTPEPDLVHECLGHMPMLANQEYADLVQAIGEVSLGANEKMIWHLTKVYWYTVEFGLIREEDKVKAFGAGVLSSYGELQHMARIPELLPFDPFQKLPKMSYKDGYQKAYYVLNSFEDAEQKLRELARAMKDPLHPFSL